MCILAHENGYRQVQMLFKHSPQTIAHCFKRMLHVVGALAVDMIQAHEIYNYDAAHHHPDLEQYLFFQVSVCCVTSF